MKAAIFNKKHWFFTHTLAHVGMRAHTRTHTQIWTYSHFSRRTHTYMHLAPHTRTKNTIPPSHQTKKINKLGYRSWKSSLKQYPILVTSGLQWESSNHQKSQKNVKHRPPDPSQERIWKYGWTYTPKHRLLWVANPYDILYIQAKTTFCPLLHDVTFWLHF